MKRVIKFNQSYSNEGIKFSDCSTNYTVLPILVPDRAGEKALETVIFNMGLTALGKVLKGKKNKYGHNRNLITHAVKIGVVDLSDSAWGGSKQHDEFIGFITLNESGSLPAVSSVNNTITEDQANEIVYNQEYGVSDVGEMVDGAIVVVKRGWNYYHELPLLGYSLESFQTVLNITEQGFEGETLQCSDCCKYDYDTNGYENNFRFTDDGNYGINCGCYDAYAKNNIENFANNPNNPIESTLAKELEENNVLEFVKRYIGGITDGRGGYYDGEACDEGDPKEILKSLSKSDPDGEYVFSLDEVGQFQMYFSVYRIAS